MEVEELLLSTFYPWLFDSFVRERESVRDSKMFNKRRKWRMRGLRRVEEWKSEKFPFNILQESFPRNWEEAFKWCIESISNQKEPLPTQNVVDQVSLSFSLRASLYQRTERKREDGMGIEESNSEWSSFQIKQVERGKRKGIKLLVSSHAHLPKRREKGESGYSFHPHFVFRMNEVLWMVTNKQDIEGERKGRKSWAAFSRQLVTS